MEDDINIREIERYALKNSGYEVEEFEGSASFFKRLEKNIPSLILLDIMLPGEDGLDILTRIRADKATADVPVIMVTAKTSELDKVKGLDLGADDYITKPFGVMELISRVKALLRRTSRINEDSQLIHEDILMDMDKHAVTVAGQLCELTFKEFELLKYLMLNQGIVLSRDKIMDQVWGFEYEGESRTVDMHIKTLRQKLGAAGSCIKTIVVTAVCSMFLFYQILEEQIFDDLKASAHVVSVISPNELSKDITYSLENDGLRITCVDVDGTVLYDSMEDASSMENHKERPEIAEAIKNGEGKSIRVSATSSKHTFYYALRKEDGSVVRVAKESGSIYHLVSTMSGLILAVGLMVFLMCVFYSYRLTRRLMAPIGKMADNIILVDETEVYEEMRPFISMIKKQHMDILNHAQMRQEFTANVSHELKTPLTAISGYAELIASGMTGGEDTAHFANEIHKSAERLQALINDIIKLSELDDSDLKLEFETVDLHDLGEQCIHSMQMQADKNEVTLHLEGASVPMNGNKTLLEELLFNLCSNAVRYNKNGGSVTIVTTIENTRPVLIVKDTGIGIPKEQQERVFERFYRVDKSRSKSTGGTGLGLAIVKHIVAQHDAQMTLTSEVGVGTEIKIVF